VRCIVLTSGHVPTREPDSNGSVVRAT